MLCHVCQVMPWLRTLPRREDVCHVTVRAWPARDRMCCGRQFRSYTLYMIYCYIYIIIYIYIYLYSGNLNYISNNFPVVETAARLMQARSYHIRSSHVPSGHVMHDGPRVVKSLHVLSYCAGSCSCVDVETACCRMSQDLLRRYRCRLVNGLQVGDRLVTNTGTDW